MVASPTRIIATPSTITTPQHFHSLENHQSNQQYSGSNNSSSTTTSSNSPSYMSQPHMTSTCTAPMNQLSNMEQQQQPAFSSSYPPQQMTFPFSKQQPTSFDYFNNNNNQSNHSSLRSSPDQCGSPNYNQTHQSSGMSTCYQQSMYNTNSNQSMQHECTLPNCAHVNCTQSPYTVSSWQVDEACSSSRIPGKIRSRCDPKCFFHWKNQKMTVDDNLLFPMSQNPVFHVDCKKISKKQHHHSHHKSCKITFDDSLSYPPHKSNVNNQSSMFEFVPFKLESLPKDYSLSYMTNSTKKKPNFYASQATNHQTSLSELRNRLSEEKHKESKKPDEIPYIQPVQQSMHKEEQLSPKGTRTRIFSIKELLN